MRPARLSVDEASASSSPPELWLKRKPVTLPAGVDEEETRWRPPAGQSGEGVSDGEVLCGSGALTSGFKGKAVVGGRMKGVWGDREEPRLRLELFLRPQPPLTG